MLAGRVTVVEGDFTEEYFPVLLTAVRALRGSELPLWNPYSNGGQPLLADPQSALFYPPTWLALAGISGTDGASFLALERLIPLHLVLAAWFAYVLGRVMLSSRLGALLVGVVYSLSGFLTSYPIEQLPILRSAAWFPLVLALLWLALVRARWLWGIGAGLAFGMAILAGHPQTAFLQTVGAAVMAGTWVYRRWAVEGASSSLVRALLSFGLMVGLGFATAAAQILPTNEFVQVSNRHDVDFVFLAGGFALWELPLDLLIPRILGGRPPYVGVLTLALAIVGLLAARGLARGVACTLALTGLLLSTGAHTFLYAALYNLVPGFDFFRGQERSIMLFALGAALLAGMGVEVLARPITGPARDALVAAGRTAAVGAGLVGGLSAALYWRSLEAGPMPPPRWEEVIRWSLFCCGALVTSVVLLAARVRTVLSPRLLSCLAVALVGLDLAIVGWHTHLTSRGPQEVYPGSVVIDRILEDLGTGRVYDDWVLRGNHGQAYGLPTVTRTFPLHLDRFEQATNRIPRERLLDLLNVRYVTTWEGPSPSRQPIVQESDVRGSRFLYRRAALGPAWIVPEGIIVPGGWEAVNLVAEPDFDPRARVVLEATQVSELRRGGFGQVLTFERSFNRIELTADTPSGGYLVVSEPAYPAWRAEVDGRDVQVLHADYLLQGLWLSPGRHRIVLSLQPTTAIWGVGISVATLFGSIAFLGGVAAGQRLPVPEAAPR